MLQPDDKEGHRLLDYLYFEQRLKGLAYSPEKQRVVDTIGCHAMISWRRANMLGEYAISDERLRNSSALRHLNPAA